jgi:hypothetical protein|tara:strand:- start:11 stop:388 length:378 start_codon:yes stop_codon:yes gene_type:complete
MEGITNGFTALTTHANKLKDHAESVFSTQKTVPPQAVANEQPESSSQVQQGGGKSRKRALTPWNKFVKKVYHENKHKPGYKFKDALKDASRRKNEMGKPDAKKHRGGSRSKKKKKKRSKGRSRRR